jgi:hypothetical protein
MLAACDKAKREEATASVLDAMVKLVGQVCLMISSIPSKG